MHAFLPASGPSGALCLRPQATGPEATLCGEAAEATFVPKRFCPRVSIRLHRRAELHKASQDSRPFKEPGMRLVSWFWFRVCLRCQESWSAQRSREVSTGDWEATRTRSCGVLEKLGWVKWQETVKKYRRRLMLREETSLLGTPGLEARLP